MSGSSTGRRTNRSRPRPALPSENLNLKGFRIQESYWTNNLNVEWLQLLKTHKQLYKSEHRAEDIEEGYYKKLLRKRRLERQIEELNALLGIGINPSDTSTSTLPDANGEKATLLSLLDSVTKELNATNQSLPDAMEQFKNLFKCEPLKLPRITDRGEQFKAYMKPLVLEEHFYHICLVAYGRIFAMVRQGLPTDEEIASKNAELKELADAYSAFPVPSAPPRLPEELSMCQISFTPLAPSAAEAHYRAPRKREARRDSGSSQKRHQTGESPNTSSSLAHFVNIPIISIIVERRSVPRREFVGIDAVNYVEQQRISINQEVLAIIKDLTAHPNSQEWKAFIAYHEAFLRKEVADRKIRQLKNILGLSDDSDLTVREKLALASSNSPEKKELERLMVPAACQSRERKLEAAREDYLKFEALPIVDINGELSIPPPPTVGDKKYGMKVRSIVGALDEEFYDLHISAEGVLANYRDDLQGKYERLKKRGKKSETDPATNYQAEYSQYNSFHSFVVKERDGFLTSFNELQAMYESSTNVPPKSENLEKLLSDQCWFSSEAGPH